MSLNQMFLILAVLAALLLALVGNMLLQAHARKAAKTPAEPKAAKPRKTRKKSAEPVEPEPEPAPRRRGLQALSGQALTEPSAREDSHVPGADTPPSMTLYVDVEARLEQLFSQFESGSISIETYQRQIAAETQDVQRQTSQLRARVDSGEFDSAADHEALASAERACEALAWCAQWAAQQTDATKA
jgi:hypothetical protein